MDRPLFFITDPAASPSRLSADLPHYSLPRHVSIHFRHLILDVVLHLAVDKIDMSYTPTRLETPARL